MATATFKSVAEELDIIVLSSSEDEDQQSSGKNATSSKPSFHNSCKAHPTSTESHPSLPSDQLTTDVQKDPLTHFISACSSYMKGPKEQHILKKLESLAASVDPEFLHSRWLRNKLLSSAESVVLDSKNVFVYIKEIYDELKSRRRKVKAITDHHSDSSHISAKAEESSASLNSPKCQNVQTNLTASPSTSTVVPKPADENLCTSTDINQENGTDEKRRSHIEKLERLLQKLDRKIRKIEDTELSLDDLKKPDSAYVLEEVYKKRFMKVWNMLCRVRGHSASTGRPTERKLVFSSSRYPEINNSIKHFINRQKKFPDFIDIFNIVKKTNEEVPLNLSPSQIHATAREIFLSVGNELQRRRKADLTESLSCFALREPSSAESTIDPAELDEALRDKLEASRKSGESRLQEVINKYAQQQEMLKLEPEVVQDDVADEEEEEDESEEYNEEAHNNTSDEDAPLSDEEDAKLDLSSHIIKAAHENQLPQDVQHITVCGQVANKNATLDNGDHVSTEPFQQEPGAFCKIESIVSKQHSSTGCSPTTCDIDSFEHMNQQTVSTIKFEPCVSEDSAENGSVLLPDSTTLSPTFTNCKRRKNESSTLASSPCSKKSKAAEGSSSGSYQIIKEPISDSHEIEVILID